MYLPAPLRTVVTAIRRRSAERTTIQEFKATAEHLSRSNDLGQIRSAITRVLSPPSFQEKSLLKQIENRRQELSASDASFEDIDYGAGYSAAPFSQDQQYKDVRQVVSVKEATSWTQDPIGGAFLFHLVRELNPARVLEMGTCVGISGSFIASAMKLNGRGKLLTLEGSPGSSAIARETFDSLGLRDYAKIRTGPFHTTLAAALAEGPYDLVFVDGHHDGAATLRYLEQIKQHISPSATIVFDDIDWSDDMARAWREIAESAPSSTRVKHLGIACY